MLSICIPIYQYEVFNLVKELNKQCNLASNPFEIICIDDNSDSIYKKNNRRIEEFNNVSYYQLESNIGRSKIRNLFINKANYNSLLFLDCDCSVPNTDFVQNYLNNIQYDITYGGRKHHEAKPSKDTIVLRWKYGKEREDLTIKERIKAPFISFRSNNFMIQKHVFSRVNFDETITKYGHEDTLFAFQLKKEKININHIENIVIHEGLENNSDFIEKTKIAVDNLNELIKSNKLEYNEIKLFKTIKSLENNKLIFFIKPFSSLLIKKSIKKLLEKNPKIFWLDIFKLFYLIQIRQHNV